MQLQAARLSAGELHVKQGRAPVLDALLPGGAVPNDVDLGGGGLRAMVISGPNMGGKSCYMCQVRRACALRPRFEVVGESGTCPSPLALASACASAVKTAPSKLLHRPWTVDTAPEDMIKEQPCQLWH